MIVSVAINVCGMKQIKCFWEKAHSSREEKRRLFCNQTTQKSKSHSELDCTCENKQEDIYTRDRVRMQNMIGACFCKAASSVQVES